MHLSLAVKLAWANTTNNWQRLLVRCSGVTFAVVLMFMQTGFRNALFDSNVRMMEEKITTDIVLRIKSRFMMSSGQQLALRKVIAARSCQGVRTAEPIYIENNASEYRRPGFPARKIRVIAIDPSSDSFAKLNLAELTLQLAEPGTAAVDVKSKPMFNLPRTNQELTVNSHGELAGQSVHLVGLFECGINFSNDGTLLMTPQNFAKYFSFRGDGNPLSQPDYGIVRCTDGAVVSDVVARLQEMLGPNVNVQTKADFLKSERSFWGKNTPIGLIFWVGTMIGFVVGLIICYQVLATDIADHMGEFATIKAMGYPTSFFGALVITQALLLSFASFVPGFIISLITFEAVNLATGLVMFLNFERSLIVLGLTVLMCVTSGIIALRKLLSADPASLF
jgi:putative ABC transport system permease protein